MNPSEKITTNISVNTNVRSAEDTNPVDSKKEAFGQLMANIAKHAEGDILANARAALSNHDDDTHIGTIIFFRTFVTLSTSLSVAEAILIGWDPVGKNIDAQLFILGVSTFLCILGILVTVYYMEDYDISTQSHIPIYKRILHAFDILSLTELVLLIWGWVCIFEAPGLAALRCFRLLRMLWYFEFIKSEHDDHFFMLHNTCAICLRYMEKLYLELFSVKSKGASIVLGMFFYSSYIIAVVFWQEIDKIQETEIDENIPTHCNSLKNCFLTVLRLAFYDGDGFDLLRAIANSSKPGLSVLLILYLCLSAMVLLNGLIGIFGGLFNASDAGHDIMEVNNFTKTSVSNLKRMSSVNLQNQLEEKDPSRQINRAPSFSLQQHQLQVQPRERDNSILGTFSRSESNKVFPAPGSPLAALHRGKSARFARTQSPSTNQMLQAVIHEQQLVIDKMLSINRDLQTIVLEINTSSNNNNNSSNNNMINNHNSSSNNNINHNPSNSGLSETLIE